MQVLDDEAPLGEGLAWVAAVDKTSFCVYNYWSVEELRKDADSLEGAFPIGDYPKIMKKLNENSEP